MSSGRKASTRNTTYRLVLASRGSGACSPKKQIRLSPDLVYPGSAEVPVYLYRASPTFWRGVLARRVVQLSVLSYLVKMSDQSGKLYGEPREDLLDRVHTSGGISIPPQLFEQLYLAPKSNVSGKLRQTFGNPTPVGKTYSSSYSSISLTCP